jgi:monofunctional biosynthetic peptidoglycan transglycosylase
MVLLEPPHDLTRPAPAAGGERTILIPPLAGGVRAADPTILPGPRVDVPPAPVRPVDRPRATVPTPRRRHRFLRRLFVALLLLQLVLAGLIVSLRWWSPPRTAFMVESGGPVTYQHVSLDHVSRFLLAAVIAHEDQQLGTRTGAFTPGEFAKRAEAYLSGSTDPSGSTIPQQLAKNVFLWPHQDPLRKGVEAVLSSEMALAISDQRMLELYVNYAQFGPGLYGICAATWFYFGEPPWDMTQYQAAQLMGVLPDPDRVRRAAGGGLDIGPTADPSAVELINGAANNHVPRELAGMGGWERAVATVGIHDTAADHAADRGADSCSTMPPSVAELIGQP